MQLLALSLHSPFSIFGREKIVFPKGKKYEQGFEGTGA
jgi:hypothetical protein